MRSVPYLRRVKVEMEALNKLRIKVGIQGDADSELLMIANVHEYGATITAKNARNLAIPIHKDSYDKSPRDFQGPISSSRSEDGLPVRSDGTRPKNGDANNLNFLFLLAAFRHHPGAPASSEAVSTTGRTNSRRPARQPSTKSSSGRNRQRGGGPHRRAGGGHRRLTS